MKYQSKYYSPNGIICVLVASMLFAQPARAALPLSQADYTPRFLSAEATTTLHDPALVEAEALTVTLTSDSPTLLGNATHLTATLAPTSTLNQWRWISSTVDSSGSVGAYTSLAIGLDGLPVISNWDNIKHDLKVAKCQTASCGSAISSTVDSAGDVGEYTSLAIGLDGLPVISYRDATKGDLKVAKCQTVSCASVISTSVDSVGDVGFFTSLAIGLDDLPVIGYWDASTGSLKVAKCQTVNCASVISTTVDSGGTGWDISLAVGPDGLPVISYYHPAKRYLQVAKCQTTSCAAVTHTIVDSSTLNTGRFTSLAIAPDGLPVISYYDNINGALKVAKCQTAGCTSAISTTVDSSSGDTGRGSSIKIGVDGLPVISYRDANNKDLKVAKCLTTSCASVISSTVDSFGDVGGSNSLAIGWDGLPIISYGYFDAGTGLTSLKVAKALPAVTYTLDYGDGTPAVTGAWGAATFPFTHTYAAVGNYTAVITATNGLSTTSASSVVVVKAPPPIPLTVTLTSDSPTLLGNATHLTGTLAPTSALNQWRWISTTVDSNAGDVGANSSLKIGQDGLPVISYYDNTNGDLKVAQCQTVSCINVISTTVDSAGDVGRDSALAIGLDGLPVISYWDYTNRDLKMVRCQTLSCISVIRITVDSFGDVGGFNSLAIGSDGLQVISYYDNTNGDLKVAKCQTASCTSAISTTVDSVGDVGLGTTLAIGRNGLPVIGYYDFIKGDLKVAQCQTVSCTSVISSTVDSAGDVGRSQNSLAIGLDGLPVISYWDYTNFDLKVAQCQTVSCTSVISTTVDSAGIVGLYASLAIGRDGLPVISYYDLTNSDLKVAQCQTVSCTSDGSVAVIRTTVDSVGRVGESTSLAIGLDGLPVISYYDGTNGDLKVARALAAVTYTLNYGDGTPVVTGGWGAAALPFTHTYAAAGNYTALITATNGLSTTSASSVVVVTSPPVTSNTLTVTLASDSPTLLGIATHLTGSLTRTTALVVTYTLNYGDGTPVVTGAWGAATLPFTHTYAAIGNYTTLLTATNGLSSTSATARVTILTNDGLLGTLTSVVQGRQITYTLIVTNASPTLPATHVIISGSVPANARLLNAGTALGSTTGGDYGTGYAQSTTALTLAPGQSTRLVWVVEVVMPISTVITRCHAASDSSTIALDAIIFFDFHRINLAILFKQ